MGKQINYSTKTILVGGIVSIAIAILSGVFISLTNINKINKSFVALEEIQEVSKDLFAQVGVLNVLQIESLVIAESNSSSVHNAIKASMNSKLSILVQKSNEIKENISQNKELFESFGNGFNELHAQTIEINQLLTEYLQNDRSNQASSAASVYYNNRLNPKVVSIIAGVNTLTGKIDAMEVILIQAVEDNGSSARSKTWLFTVISVLVLVVVSFLFWRIIGGMALDLRTSVIQLKSFSESILGTISSISSGSTETATAISETTTTVEEVRQTAMVANNKAKVLLDSAQKAQSSVAEGQKSVQQVIESMRNIDDQMRLIAKTVVKLSEQNLSIGEITTSVTDIADQSNLLAVNAAIEAAKAGDHGRGFSIVAQEIRSLAEQSKKATMQVKEILNEIQNSVNHAVEVTSTGSKTVEEGIHMVSQNGSLFEMLAKNVEDSGQSAIQISSSSQQQMVGMDQIVPAMENIKTASEHNLEGISKITTVSKEINELGMKLTDAIKRYNL